ncbi:MFS transporter [Pseudonocardia sp. CA-142604]|uniref:MFS transporter n=1 Tax=Pseudonocardia sp. CA-142604 TaxID=3240024 RepID=UPI003D90B34A
MTTATAEIPASTTATTHRRGTFAALRVHNYRIYIVGHGVASTGTWMQSIALDWLVLELTGSSAAVGITMAMQFLPMLLLGVHGGMIADRYPKRAILMVTQGLNCSLSGTLAVLTLTGQMRVEFVYLLALLQGLVMVVDNPTRQVFVNELVPTHYVRNAIALNAAVFQTSRLLGPAVSGVLIGTVGTGWAFAANATSYAAPLIGLTLIRSADLVPAPAVQRAKGQLRSALRYVRERPDVAWTIFLVGVIGTFGLKFPVVLTAMADTTFHGGADLYGLFNVVIAVGSVVGALIAGGRTHTRLRTLVVAAFAFGLAQTAAALSPELWAFLGALIVLGVVNLTFQAMANSSVQSWVDPQIRGRVMGLYMLVFVGGTPLGGPMIGWITTAFGPRVAMAFCGIVPALAAVAVGLVLWLKARGRLGRRGPVPQATG